MINQQGSAEASVNSPSNYEEVRMQVKTMLPVPVEFDDDDNLIELGLDSLKIMRMVNKWRRAGSLVTFADLIEAPRLSDWWSLLQKNNLKLTVMSGVTSEVEENKDENESFPLTDVQHAYWIGRRDDQPLGGVGCHAYLEIDGKRVEPKRLESAWTQLLTHHSMLRAKFLSDGRQEVLDTPFSQNLPVHDFQRCSKSELKLELKKIRERLSHRRLAVEKGEVIGLELSLLPDGYTRLHFDVDLLVADVQSLQIIIRDLAAGYSRGCPPAAPLDWNFSTYLKQEEQRRSSDIKKARNYWTQRLSTLPGAPGLPLKQKPEAITRPVFTRRTYIIKNADWTRLQKQSAIHQVTPAMVLLTVYAEILDRWSTNSRFLINIPLFDRQTGEAGIEDVVADFTNLLLLAVDCSAPQSFKERVRSVQTQFHKDVNNAAYSGVQVQRDIVRARQGERMIAPVVFACNLGTPLINTECRETLGELSYMISQTPQVWLDFQIYETEGKLLLAWDAVEALFPDGLIDSMFAAYARHIEWIVEEDNDWKSSPNLLPADQRQRRDREIAFSVPPDAQCLHTSFFLQASAHPERIALIDSQADIRLTYDELATSALRVAAWLREQGVREGDPVAITMPRGIDQITAVLGILACGACYVPVNTQQPAIRRERIHQKAGIRYVLTDSVAARETDWPYDVVVIDIAQCTDAGTLAQPVALSPDLTAYIIFTSGSTGEPKGVEVAHRAAWNTIAEVNRRHAVTEADRVLAVSALDFDLSVYDIFGLLTVGGALVLIPESERREAAFWVKAVERYQVTIWNSVPVLLDMLLVVAESDSRIHLLLRWVMLSGDWIGLDLPSRLAQVTENCGLVAMGGATEAAIWSNYFDVTLPIPEHWTSIPYGQPLPGQAFRVVDPKGRDCPDWVAGELWIGGAGVAKGYRGEPELTSDRFVFWEGSVWYRTGDLGRYLPNGNLEFLGRMDFQVKVGGNRIEPGEIEAALTEHPKVKDAVVLALGEKQGPKVLTCFVLTPDLPESGSTAKEEPIWDASILKKDGATLLEPMERLQFKLGHPGLRSHTPETGLPIPSPKREELVQGLSRRTSVRQFNQDSILWADFSQLITGLMGKTFANTPYPKFSYGSAGGLYPVQTYIMVKPGRIENLEGGLYYYHPLNHCLLSISANPGITSTQFQTGNHLIFQSCAFALFLLADMEAVRPMYGRHARDFCLLEAGALTHHLETLCFDYGIGFCQIGALNFTPMREFFDLKGSHEYLHCLLGGKVNLPEGWKFLDGQENPKEVPDNTQGLENDLVSFLKDRLVAHMIPARYNFLESFPLTANGKVDRKALGRLNSFVFQKEMNFRPPETPTQQCLARILSQTTGVQFVGLEDSFFELGGDSLMALRLTNILKETFKVDLPLAEFFKNPTLMELARVLDAMAGKERPAPSRTISPSEDNAHEPFPLTEIQQAYWIGRSSAFELGRVATHFYLELENPDLDIPRLNLAWQRLVDRHPMLRAVILPDGKQKILPEVPPYQFEVMDLGNDKETCLSAIRQEMSHQVLPADTWPLFDIRVSRLEGGGGRLHISLDALIMDAWSSFLVFNEWYALYRDEALTLPPLALTFRNYVMAADQKEESPEFQRSKIYWHQRLPLLPSPPRLPLKIHPSALTSSRFTRRSAHLDAHTWKALKTRGGQFRLTPSGILIAAYAEVLTRWSRDQEMTINVTLFNRPDWHPEINKIIGDFTSLIPLGIVPDPGLNFARRAAAVQEQLWVDMDHRHFGGILAIRELAQLKGTPKKAMFPVVFTSALSLEGFGHTASVISRLGRMVFGISQTPQVWLDNQVMEQDGALVFNWDALEDLFPSGVLDAMFGSYCQLLERLALDPSTWERTSMDLLPQSQSTFWETFNSTGIRLPKQNRLLHTLFLEQAARDPHHTAVIHGERRLSYGKLSEYMFTIAAVLRARGATINTPVAVIMEKGWEQVAAVLGILQSGAPYLPVDPDLPENRILGILEDAEVRIALVSTNCSLGFHQLPDIECICVGTVEAEPARESEPLQSQEDLAYILYTSGSTGSPKGVMISHRGVVNTILDINRRFEIGRKDRVLALSDLGFDLSVFDIFGILAAGGALVICESSKDPGHWVDLMKKENVTLWNTAPALMQMLTDHLAHRETPAITALRLVLLSGDWIPKSLPDRIRQRVAQARVISLGGATEASIWSVFHSVEKTEDWASIPYGRPLANQRLLVLNRRMERCPIWVPGDLYIGGQGLLKGYWRDESKTRESLIVHPITGETLYRTGDLARMRPKGLLEFLGREDHQVKINGHRVELGEIESQLKDVAGIQDAVVTVQENRNGQGGLAAYIISDDTDRTDTRHIRNYLKANLPRHMIPRYIQVLDRFPVTMNGKVDRKRLPRPDTPAANGAVPDRLPRTDTEKAILAIWAVQLKMEDLTVNQDYFEVGGDSLRAVRIVHTVKTDLGVEIPLQDFFENPTPARLARLVDECLELGEALALEEGEI